jgi:hypothetical protein
MEYSTPTNSIHKWIRATWNFRIGVRTLLHEFKLGSNPAVNENIADKN